MSDLSPIPDGFNTVTAYLVVTSSVEALAFYAKAFGAEERMRMPGPGDSTMHAEVRIGDSVVMMTDENPAFQMKSAKTLGGSPVSMHLYVEDADAAFEKATAAGCEVAMPLQDVFWGDRFGKVLDPFGITWSIACRKEVVSPEEMAKRQAALMEQMAKGEAC